MQAASYQEKSPGETWVLVGFFLESNSEDLRYIVESLVNWQKVLGAKDIVLR